MRGKLQSMLQSGVYLGRTHSSAENLIGTPDGVVKARDIYRRTAEERFNLDEFKSIVGTPWKCTPTRNVEIDEIPEFEVIPVEMRRSGEHADGVGEAIPRRVKLTKEIMERFDFTPQCPGCINMRLNRPHRAHTEQCRERVEEKVREDVALRWRVEAAHARQAAWTERERIRLGMPSAEPAIRS